VPVPDDERTIETFALEEQVSHQQSDENLLKLLDRFAPDATKSDENANAVQKYDGKQLGDLYVSLIGIYNTNQKLRAILQIQDKTDKTKQLSRLSVDESVKDIYVQHLDTRSITMRYQQQEVTLVLFIKANEATLVEP
jgi:hypothetical protein